MYSRYQLKEILDKVKHEVKIGALLAFNFIKGNRVTIECNIHSGRKWRVTLTGIGEEDYSRCFPACDECEQKEADFYAEQKEDKD